MPTIVLGRLLAAALCGCAVLLLPTPGTAQQTSDLSPLVEELLKQLSEADGSAPAGTDEGAEDAEEPEIVTPVIPPPQPAVAAESVFPTTPLPPIAGPEAELARQLLAITDTEENQEEVREDLARDFLRRLRGPLLEAPQQAEEAAAAETESSIILAQDQSGIPDGEELIFEVRIENRRFLQSLFGIKRGDGVFVDLAEASELLELAIEVDPSSGTAAGFFINPSNTFSLDLDRREVTIEGETIPVAGEDVVRQDNSILVHSDLFGVWFNIRLDVDFRNLVVNVIPETPLPLQQRLSRQERIASLRRGRRAEPSLPRLDDPYRAVALPLADIRLQSSLVDSPGQELRTTQTYSVVGRGDLAFATGDFFFGGTRDDVLNSARLTLRREDPTGGLLGPLQATKIEAGDVIAPGLPVGGTGVGAFVTNNTTGVQNLGTTTDFVGNEQPGTDVELYRNGILINLVTVGEDGRYEFRDVPLQLGENEFRLVFYATTGAIREQRESRTVTSVGRVTTLPTYSAAIFKPGDPLIPVQETAQEEGPLASAVTVRQTFANGISASAGLSFVDTGDPSTGEIDAGVSAPVAGGIASLQTTTSLDSGWQATAQLRTRYREQAIGLQYSTTRASSPSNSDSFRADVSGGIPLIGDRSIPYSAFVSRSTEESGLVNDQAELRNSTGLGRYRLSHALTWNQIDVPSAEDTRSLTGNLQNALLFNPVNARIGFTYRLIEQRELQRVDGELNWTINNRAQARLGYDRFLLSKREAYSLGANYRFDRFVLSPTLTYDSNDQLFALLSLSTAIGREPISGRVITEASTFTSGGVVAARVYQDDNLNRQYDPGEPLIEDAQIEAVHSNRRADTNEDGIAYLSRLPPYLLTDVRVRPGTLPDPFMASLEPGRSILPRPGRTNVLDFPVTLTSEVEGGVVALRDGELVPLPGVSVVLRNEAGEIVATEETLFDGFFLFVTVFPGEYSLELLPDNVVSEGFVVPPPRRVTISRDGEPVLGVQIVTGPPGADLPPPADARVASVDLGVFPTIESARAALVLYRGLVPDRLNTLALETPLEAQAPPYALRLGRVSTGAADNICGRLRVAKVDCEVVTHPYVPDAPLVPTLSRTPQVSDAAADAVSSGDDGQVVVSLGRYPDDARATAAWAVLQRLYAPEFEGVVRQPTAANDLVVGTLSRSRAVALCSRLGDVVPTCDIAPVPSADQGAPGPMVQNEVPATLPTLSRVPASPVEPVVAAALPAESRAVQAPPAAASTDGPSGGEVVSAVLLGDYGSQTGVATGWQLLRRLYPNVLGQARLLDAVEPEDDRKQLLAGPFSELNALAVCARLLAEGQTCRVAQARI